MKVDLERLTRVGSERVNPFYHVFMYLNLVFAVCFIWLPDASGASETSLYELTTIQTAESTTSIWGACALVACVAMTYAFFNPLKFLGGIASMFGFGVWLFAAITYAIGGFWFGLIVTAVPNVFFWSWLYFVVSRMRRDYEERALT